MADAKQKLIDLLTKRVEHGLSEFDVPEIVEAIQALIDDRINKTIGAMTGSLPSFIK